MKKKAMIIGVIIAIFVIITAVSSCYLHSAVLSGRWCGDQRPLCGPAAGECQTVEFGFITTV